MCILGFTLEGGLTFSLVNTPGRVTRLPGLALDSQTSIKRSFSIKRTLVKIGVRAGGLGALQPHQSQKFLKFLVQNADYSGKSTQEKTFSKDLKGSQGQACRLLSLMTLKR